MTRRYDASFRDKISARLHDAILYSFDDAIRPLQELRLRHFASRTYGGLAG